MEENGKKNLKIAVVMRDTEVVFPVSAEQAHCAGFFVSFIALIRDPRVTKLEDVESLQRIELHGKVYGKPHFKDGETINTSPIIRIEKIKNQSEATVLDRFCKRVCWWKRMRQSFRFITESGSAYIVSMATLAKRTYKLLDAARCGAIDEMKFRRGIF